MNEFLLWFLTKRRLINVLIRYRLLYQAQQDQIERLTDALEASAAGATTAKVMRTFYRNYSEE